MFRPPSFHFNLSFVVVGPLCPSSEIEPSADDVHAELAEDEDEEVTLQAVVVMVVLVKREENKIQRNSYCPVFLFVIG